MVTCRFFCSNRRVIHFAEYIAKCLFVRNASLCVCTTHYMWIMMLITITVLRVWSSASPWRHFLASMLSIHGHKATGKGKVGLACHHVLLKPRCVIMKLFKEDILAEPQKARPRVFAFFLSGTQNCVSCLFTEPVKRTVFRKTVLLFQFIHK
jgi:hypothetical protein